MKYTTEQILLARQWQDWHEMDESESIDASNTLDEGERKHHLVRAAFAFENLCRVQGELEKTHGIKDTSLDDLLYAVLVKDATE